MSSFINGVTGIHHIKLKLWASAGRKSDIGKVTACQKNCFAYHEKNFLLKVQINSNNIDIAKYRPDIMAVGL